MQCVWVILKLFPTPIPGPWENCFPQNQSLVPKRPCATELNNRMDTDPGSTDANAEAPVLWPSDANNIRTGKVSDAGKDWGQEEKGVTADGMVGWHHRLDGHGFEQTLGDSEGQGSLAYWGWWVLKDLGTLFRFSDWTTRAVSYCGGEVRSDFPRSHRARFLLWWWALYCQKDSTLGTPQAWCRGLCQGRQKAAELLSAGLCSPWGTTQLAPSSSHLFLPGLHLSSEVSKLYEF